MKQAKVSVYDLLALLFLVGSKERTYIYVVISGLISTDHPAVAYSMEWHGLSYLLSMVSKATNSLLIDRVCYSPSTHGLPE